MQVQGVHYITYNFRMFSVWNFSVIYTVQVAQYYGNVMEQYVVCILFSKQFKVYVIRMLYATGMQWL